MADGVRSLVDRIRQPEHTGENRCVPCTAANVLIAAGASAVVAVAVSTELGVVCFVGAVAVIALRGYLVPGTPALTERFLPDRVLAAFEKRPARQVPGRTGHSVGDDGNGTGNDGSVEGDDGNGTVDDGNGTTRDGDGPPKRVTAARDPERFLADRDVLEPCEREAGRCLTRAFADRLRRLTDRRGESVDADAVAALFDEDPDAVSIEGDDHPGVSVGYRRQSWPSTAALVADVAGHEALADHTDDWADVPREHRLAVLRSLRSFRERCPLCGGAVERSSSPAESCCRSYDVITVACVDCGEPLLELDPTVLDSGSTSDVAGF